MCSPTLLELDTRALISRLLGGRVSAVEELGGGRNSRVFRVGVEGNDPVAVKVYTGAERLRAEYRALEFLWAKGLRLVPQPLLANPELGCAVYQFIPGERIRPGEVSGGDIDAAVAFLGTLRDLAQRPDSQDLPPASEACLTLEGICGNIAQRLECFAGLPDQGEPCRQLHRFLAEDFAPELERIRCWGAAHAGSLWHTPLAAERSTLSPSDFGFHNALRQPDGKLVFLDFEHFGWDDPAKMAADFLLHPHEDMAFNQALKERFLEQLLSRFDDPDKWLRERVRLALPLYGLKWCMILLNEFLPAAMARRRFAVVHSLGEDHLRTAQLEKARAMLRRSQQARTLFPQLG